MESYRKENTAAWKSKSIVITVFLDWQTIDGKWYILKSAVCEEMLLPVNVVSTRHFYW